MRTKSYMDISAQWKRLHALTFRGSYAENQQRAKGWWRIANKIVSCYQENIIREYDRIHGYKAHRNLWEQIPASVYQNKSNQY